MVAGEPLIVAFGRHHIASFREEQFLAAMRKSFLVECADFIVLDSLMTGQKFRAACVAWAVDKGFLDHSGTDDRDEQCTVYSFRLTRSGMDRLLEGDGKSGKG